jgi:RND family efflux transporter MFP subunit
MVATGIAQARSGLQAIGAQISGLRREQERLRKLVADGIVAPAQLDQISDQIRALQGQRGQIQAGREQAELAAGNTVVRSTLTGVVTRRMVEVGDLVSPMSPMAVIVSLDEVFVWIDVPEYELEGVRARETVEVTVESAPERVLAGRLDLVSPTVDRESRSVRVRYRVSNPDWLLRNGMVARVAVETERVEDVPAVPMAALSLDLTELGQEQTFTAFVERDGAAVARTVRIGMQAGARVEVRSGLAPGDRLIVQGHHLVQDGSPVEVVEPGNGHGRSGGAGSDSPDGGAGVEAR